VTPARRIAMDKERISGAAHQVKGAVKETVGKVTGDAKTQAEGAAEKTAGKVQKELSGPAAVHYTAYCRRIRDLKQI
jgi:uncharacterized protein YjbJ (UPF0337 family)